MRTTSTIMAAALAALLLPAPVAAQAPQGGPMQRTTPDAAAPAAKSAPKAAPAKDSIGKVTWDKVSGNWKRFEGSVRKQ